MAVLLAGIALTARAEEGMWPPAHVPVADIERTFGVKLDPQVLERIQLSTIRFAGATAPSCWDGMGVSRQAQKSCITPVRVQRRRSASCSRSQSKHSWLRA